MKIKHPLSVAIVCSSQLESEALLCAFSKPPVMLEGEAPGEFMFMPAGTHSINATQGNKPVSKVIIVDASAATALQSQLEAVNTRSPQKAFFDYDHKDEQASGYPISFHWKDGPAPGVYCKVEWSKAGADAIKGKSYRAFSPVFHIDKSAPARIACRKDADLNFGGLVNDPAFENILPLWAKQQQPSTTESDDDMKKTLAELQAALKTVQTELAGIKAKSANAADLAQYEAAIAAKKLEEANIELQIQNAQLQESIQAKRKEEAKVHVDAAVARGAIPAKDEALKAKWQGWLEEKPELSSVLDALGANPALKAGRITHNGVTISRESSLSVLNAYAAERDSVKRGALYAKEIKPRLAEGDDLPLEGANSVGTLAGTLVSQRTLDLFKLEFPVLGAISTDFSSESAAFNQQIMSRIITIPTVQVYDPVTGWPAANMVATDVPVTMSAHVGIPFTVDSNTLAGTVRRLFDESAPAGAYALGKYFVDLIYALITAGNFNSYAPIVCAQIDFAKITLTQAAAVLNPAGVPMAGRVALMNSLYAQQLSNDPTLQFFYAMNNPSAITESKQGKIATFQPLEAPNLPVTGNLATFCMQKSALVASSRMPNDYTRALSSGANNGTVSTVTNVETGMSVMLTEYVDHQKGAATWRQSVMVGAAVGDKRGGQLITSGN